MRHLSVNLLVLILSAFVFGQTYNAIALAEKVMQRLQEIVGYDRAPVYPLGEALLRMKETMRTSPDKFLSIKVANIIEQLDKVLQWEKTAAGYRAKDGSIYRSLSDFYNFRRKEIEPLLSQLVSLLPKPTQPKRKQPEIIDPIDYHAKGLMWAIHYGSPSTAGYHLSELIKAITEKQKEIQRSLLKTSKTSSSTKEPKR